MGAFFSFINFLSWAHYGFMWMLYELFHAMCESNKSRFCWYIRISTEAHCVILNIIASLDSDVHESTKLFSYLPYDFSVCFSSYPVRGVAMKSVFPKYVSTENGDCWYFTSSFVFFSMFLNNIFIIWSVWSILMPYLLWILLMFSSFRYLYFLESVKFLC